MSRHDTTPKAGAPDWGRYRLTPEIARLPGTVLKVTMALAEYATPRRPWAWPKVAAIAERLGIGSAKARVWLAKAEAAGVLRKCRRRRARASLGYDLRPWFLAMGFEEARDVLPPADSLIVLPADDASALGNRAVCPTPAREESAQCDTARKPHTPARQETSRASALGNLARSSEQTTGTDNAEATASAAAVSHLVSLGVERHTAERLVKDSGVEVAEQQIACLPDRNSDDPVRMLVASIKGNYPPPATGRNREVPRMSDEDRPRRKPTDW